MNEGISQGNLYCILSRPVIVARLWVMVRDVHEVNVYIPYVTGGVEVFT